MKFGPSLKISKPEPLLPNLRLLKKCWKLQELRQKSITKLDTASLTQELESTASMILLELVTNIIKTCQSIESLLEIRTN